jgi:rhamnosyltransferase
MVARELTGWFESFAPDGKPRVDRLLPNEQYIPASALLGVRGFFTDANGCLARSAWEAVPFRQVSYAEDHALAHDMLRAGYAKVFVPRAAVIHSHEYSSWGWLQRSFDEARALNELYGYVEPLALRTTSLKLWGSVGADWRWAGHLGRRRPQRLLPRSALYHGARIAGTVLGTRASYLPAPVVARLSLEQKR